MSEFGRVQLGPDFETFVGDNKWFIPTIGSVFGILFVGGLALTIWLACRTPTVRVQYSPVPGTEPATLGQPAQALFSRINVNIV
eukprot:1127804-Rhodomonas_salina.1